MHGQGHRHRRVRGRHRGRGHRPCRHRAHELGPDAHLQGFPTGSAVVGATYTDSLTADALTTDADGSVSLTIPAGERYTEEVVAADSPNHVYFNGAAKAGYAEDVESLMVSNRAITALGGALGVTVDASRAIVVVQVVWPPAISTSR